MNDANLTTYRYLLSNYGPLLTLTHLAEVLHSTPNGVRMAVARRRQPLAIALSGARRRFGRRVYFEAAEVAKAIDQGRVEAALEPRSDATLYAGEATFDGAARTSPLRHSPEDASDSPLLDEGPAAHACMGPSDRIFRVRRQ